MAHLDLSVVALTWTREAEFASTRSGKLLGRGSDSTKQQAEHRRTFNEEEVFLDGLVFDVCGAFVKGGAKYVFVSKGKVFGIENQDLAGLEEHAGHNGKLTGDLQSRQENHQGL